MEEFEGRNNALRGTLRVVREEYVQYVLRLPLNSFGTFLRLPLNSSIRLIYMFKRGT